MNDKVCTRGVGGLYHGAGVGAGFSEGFLADHRFGMGDGLTDECDMAFHGSGDVDEVELFMREHLGGGCVGTGPERFGRVSRLGGVKIADGYDIGLFKFYPSMRVVLREKPATDQRAIHGAQLRKFAMRRRPVVWLFSG